MRWDNSKYRTSLVQIIKRVQKGENWTYKLYWEHTQKTETIKTYTVKGLNGYEIEIILRIYWKKQSLAYISYNMDFEKYGKPQKYYSVRSLNNFHKEAFMKLIS